MEGLGGQADYTWQGTISINMLDLYLSERVKQLTGGNKPHDHQTQHGSRLSHRPATLGSFSPSPAFSFLHGAACPFAMGDVKQGCVRSWPFMFSRLFANL